MAGVAKSTVSRYLNGGSVSEEKRQKIDKAIRETNYIPNNFAQSLKAKRNNLIGIVIPRLDSYATARTLAGIDEVLRESGYQLIINCTYQNKEREIESIENIISQGIAGMILIMEKVTDEHRKIINKSRIPTLLIGQEDELISCIIHDDKKAGYEAALLLMENGHRNFTYVEESKEDVSAWKRRKEGFYRALNDYGISNISVLTLDLKDDYKNEIVLVANQIISNESTAVLCATDKIALELLHIFKKKKINIPGDLSIMGIGDYEVSRLMSPELTTIHYPYKTFGKIAAEKIVGLVEEKITYEKIVIPVEKILRESVDNRKR